jgi:hypothetical protein
MKNFNFFSYSFEHEWKIKTMSVEKKISVLSLNIFWATGSLSSSKCCEKTFTTASLKVILFYSHFIMSETAELSH